MAARRGRSQTTKKSRIKVDFEDYSPEVMGRIDRRFLEALRERAPEIEARAKIEVPVDEGDLQKTVRVDIDERKGELYLKSGGPGARHAHLIEYGTIKMEANPYTRRTISKTRRKTTSVVKKHLSGP